MIELYINGIKADLSEKVSIAMTYQSEDLETPTNTKGGYSKSVELLGTQTNNQIFNNFWKLDTSVTDITFDPKKRVEFKLFSNSDLVQQGYIKLDSIKVNNSNITYSVTLYSEICDFFYNLAYNNETGEEKTLYDMYYGFEVNGETLTKEEEDKNTLFLWNKDYILGSWDKLADGDDENMEIENLVTAVPTYSGYYDDFSSDKVMLCYDSLPQEYSDYFQFGSSAGGWTPYSNQSLANAQYVMCEATRELDEWEAKDLRSIYQRYAFRTSIVLDALSKPYNNGGWNIIWDDEIKNSAYYKKSWIMMDRFDFDADYSKSSSDVIKLTYEPIVKTNMPNKAPSSASTSGWTSMGEFDTSNMLDPYCEFSFLPVLQTNGAQLFDKTNITTNTYSSWDYSEYDESGYGWSEEYKQQSDGGIIWQTAIFVNGVFLRYYEGVDRWNFLTCNDNLSDYDYLKRNLNEIEDSVGIGRNKLQPSFMKISTDDIENDAEVHKVGAAFGCRNMESKEFKIKFSLPKNAKVQIYAFATYAEANTEYHSTTQSDGYVTSSITTTASTTPSIYNYKRYGIYDKATLNNIRVPLYENEDDDLITNGVYDGNISPKLQPMVINKQILFGESKSPFDYLIGFGKALGLKFRADNGTKNIYIEPRKKYYLNKINNYNDRIDRTSYTISPTICDSKWYEWGFEQPETYASNIYLKKNKYEYGKNKLNTNYYFNLSTKNLFEKCIYTSAVPYKHSSIYFSDIEKMASVPTILLSPTFKYQRYSGTALNFDTQEINTRGYSRRSKPLSQERDKFYRLCCFDSDNGDVSDIKNCLVFFDGFDSDTTNPYIVSDNAEIMWVLNEEPCYVQCSNDYYPNESFYKLVTTIPRFSKYLSNQTGEYVESLDFKKPNLSFIGDGDSYNENVTLYNRYWKNYIDNIYGRDSRKVAIKCFLHSSPDQALREIYYFDNSYWLLYKISDYEQGLNKLTNCEFIKLTDYKKLFN